MKALISASFILLFIASCGSSSSKKTYTVTDDNNGTKNPRLKEIVTKTADNNKSEEKITRYTYNDDNLLISKKTSYVQKRKENEGTQDLKEITYTYNSDKQLKTRVFKEFQTLFNIGGNDANYTYGDIIYKNTKLPVVDTITVNSREMTCVYKHTYHLDASNFATSIDKINQTCTSSSFRNPPSDPDFYPSTSTDEGKIYSEDLSKHTEQYTYFSQSTIATYDKGLREQVAYYSPNENNATKEPELERTDTYTYEKKPYFYIESSSPMVVDLPH